MLWKHRYISDINRVAQIDDKTNYFKPHSNNDANELHAWGLGTTPISTQNKRPQTVTPQHNRPPSTPLQKPPIQNQTPQNYRKPQATSQTFNPFKIQGDKQRYLVYPVLKNTSLTHCHEKDNSNIYYPNCSKNLSFIINFLKISFAVFTIIGLEIIFHHNRLRVPFIHQIGSRDCHNCRNP